MLINRKELKCWDREDSLYSIYVSTGNNMKKYENLSDYLCNCIGVSQQRNVCACAIDLARYNDMTMGKLFEKYEG